MWHRDRTYLHGCHLSHRHLRTKHVRTSVNGSSEQWTSSDRKDVNGRNCYSEPTGTGSELFESSL